MMRRRVFSLLVFLAVMPAMSVSLHAGSSTAIMGVHEKLAGETFNFDGKTVEIAEFMSFYCHTCY